MLRDGWFGAGTGGARLPSPVHPAAYTTNTPSFPGTKQPRRGLNHPPPISTEVKNERMSVTVPLLPSWTFMARYGENFTLGVGWRILLKFIRRK